MARKRLRCCKPEQINGVIGGTVMMLVANECKHSCSKKKMITHKQLRSVAWQLIPFGALSWQGLNLIKPV